MHPFVILKLIDVVSILFTRSCRSRNTHTHILLILPQGSVPLIVCVAWRTHFWLFYAMPCHAMLRLCLVINTLTSKFCNLHIRLSLIVLEPSPPNHHNSSGKTHFLPASVINCPNAIQPMKKHCYPTTKENEEKKAKKNATRVAYRSSLTGVLVFVQMKSKCDKVLFFWLDFELYLSMACFSKTNA